MTLLTEESVFPEGFLTADILLSLLVNIVGGMMWYPSVGQVVCTGASVHGDRGASSHGYGEGAEIDRRAKRSSPVP
jgi:hypothetical protein